MTIVQRARVNRAKGTQMGLALRVDNHEETSPKTSDELQNRVRQLQAEYQKQIARLQSEGNFGGMQPLAQNFQQKIQKLVADFQAYQEAQARAEMHDHIAHFNRVINF